jgi:hypothetical protein
MYQFTAKIQFPSPLTTDSTKSYDIYEKRAGKEKKVGSATLNSTTLTALVSITDTSLSAILKSNPKFSPIVIVEKDKKGLPHLVFNVPNNLDLTNTL